MSPADQAIHSSHDPTAHVTDVGQSVRDARLEDVVDDRTREIVRRRRHVKSRRRGWLVRRALAAADVTGILLAFTLTQLAFSGNDIAGDRVSTGLEIVLFALTLPGWVVLSRLYGLYSSDEERTDHSTVDDFFGVLNMLTVGVWTFFALAYVTSFASPSFPKLALFWLLSVALVVAGRSLARAMCRRTDMYVQDTLIVGAGHVGQLLARKLLGHPEYGVNPIGFVDEHPRERSPGLADLTVLGLMADVPELVSELDVERVIITFSQAPHSDTLELIRELNQLDVQVDVVPRLFEVIGSQATIHSAEGLTLLGLPPARLSNSSLLLKRSLDVALALVGLLVLAPVLAAIALAIKLDSIGPVLFRQVRIGKGNTSFRIFKFRTMAADADGRKHEVAHLNKHLDDDPRMFKIPDDPRVTRVGRFLRGYSLDELPQLLNVLKGEMSLVGPRPLIVDEDQHVDGWARKRLDLKPGITGLWQSLGRDDIPFSEMLGLDYQYVTTWSLRNDMKLLARTLPLVIHRRSA